MKKLIIKLRRSKYMFAILRFLFKLSGILPVSKQTIVFESFLGKQFNDNPKALFDYIKQHYPDYKLYWSFDRKYKHYFDKLNINILPRFSLKWIITMGRARYWITNSRLPLWIPKPKHTIYIQTWHGTPLKKLGADIERVQMPGTTTEKYIKNFLFEADKWDFLISPNMYSTHIFKSAFDFDKNVIESGYPRNDVLYKKNNEKEILRIKKQLGIDPDKKVILYAPTWRDNHYYSTGKYKFDLQLDMEKMQESLCDDYVVLLRMHYLVQESFDLFAYKQFVRDVSVYSDVSELYLISDILITDYSSVFFDYMNLKRPVIFFVPDIDVYRDEIRGFYFDFENESPGPLLKTTDGVIQEIMEAEFSPDRFLKEREDFYDRFCYLEDGRASERVVKNIFP